MFNGPDVCPIFYNSGPPEPDSAYNQTQRRRRAATTDSFTRQRPFSVLSSLRNVHTLDTCYDGTLMKNYRDLVVTFALRDLRYSAAVMQTVPQNQQTEL